MGVFMSVLRYGYSSGYLCGVLLWLQLNWNEWNIAPPCHELPLQSDSHPFPCTAHAVGQVHWSSRSEDLLLVWRPRAGRDMPLKHAKMHVVKAL